MEGKKPTQLQRLKYSVLRFLPGRKGLHYQRQFRRSRWMETERAFQDALMKCRDKSAVDLGANVGSFTAEIASKVFKVHAFEPDPWAFRQLEERTKDMDNVVLYNTAVGHGSGTVTLYQHPKMKSNKMLSTVSSIIDESRMVRDDSVAVKVEKIDFVEFLSRSNETFGILKIDVEGAELEILERLIDSDQLNRFEYIFCETHEPELPHLLARFDALRKHANSIASPKINLDWH